MHNLKAENGVLFGRQNWGLKRRIQPQRALRDWSLEVWEEPGYRGVFPQRPGSQNIKRLLLIKENQTSQFSEFSPFLRMGRRKSGLTDVIPLMCTSASWARCPGLSPWVCLGPFGCPVSPFPPASAHAGEGRGGWMASRGQEPKSPLRASSSHPASRGC